MVVQVEIEFGVQNSVFRKNIFLRKTKYLGDALKETKIIFDWQILEDAKPFSFFTILTHSWVQSTFKVFARLV